MSIDQLNNGDLVDPLRVIIVGPGGAGYQSALINMVRQTDGTFDVIELKRSEFDSTPISADFARVEPLKLPRQLSDKPYLKRKKGRS